MVHLIINLSHDNAGAQTVALLFDEVGQFAQPHCDLEGVELGLQTLRQLVVKGLVPSFQRLDSTQS